MRRLEDLPPGSGPCRKQIVRARVVTPAGDSYEATNLCLRPQPTCPRAGMATGEGYELCKSVCQQTGHAETNALALAGDAARGAVLELEGHTYACDSCKDAASRAGIVRIVIKDKAADPKTAWVGGEPPNTHECAAENTCPPGFYQGRPSCARCRAMCDRLQSALAMPLNTQPHPDGPITLRDILEGR